MFRDLTARGTIRALRECLGGGTMIASLRFNLAGRLAALVFAVLLLAWMVS